jgi:hypothetical protein
MPVWPPAVTLKPLLISVVMDNYDGHREPLDIRFIHDHGEALRSVDDFSVCYVDGFSKALVVVAVLATISTMAPPL